MHRLVACWLFASICVANSVLAASWLEGPDISFCRSTVYRETEQSCRRQMLAFNAALCKCAPVPHPAVAVNLAPAESLRVPQFLDRELSLAAEPRPICYDVGSIDVDVDPFLGQEVNEFYCSLQMGPVAVPVPEQSGMFTYRPRYVHGPVCVAAPDDGDCVARETFTMLVDVHMLDHNDHINVTLVSLTLPSSCMKRAQPQGQGVVQIPDGTQPSPKPDADLMPFWSWIMKDITGS